MSFSPPSSILFAPDVAPSIPVFDETMIAGVITSNHSRIMPPQRSQPHRIAVDSIADLPPDAQALLAAFLICSRPLPSRALVRLAPDSAVVDVLVARKFITESEDGDWQLTTTFDHAAATRALPWSLRQQQQEEIAGLCREMGDHAGAARHATALGRTDLALTAWQAAAHHALARNDAVAALAILDEIVTLDSPSIDAIDDALIELVPLIAVEPTAADALREKLAGWLEQKSWHRRPRRIAALAPIQATLLAAQGLHAAGAHFRVRAAQTLRQQGQSADAAREFNAAGTSLMFALHYTAAGTASQQAYDEAERCEDPVLRAQIVTSRGLLRGFMGDTEPGRADLEHALDLALAHGHTSLAAEAYRILGTVAEYASCYGEEQTAFSRAISYCRRHDEPATGDLCMGCLSYSLFRSGNWIRSRRIARSVIAEGGPASRCVAEGVLGLHHANRGELREAKPRLQASREAAHRFGILGMEFFCVWGFALVEQHAGRNEAAALHYRHLLEFWQGSEDRHDAIPGLTAGALFFLDHKQDADADACLTALHHISTLTANPEAQGAVALVRGEQHRRAGRASAAITAFEHALAAFDSRDLMIERIHTQLRLSAALRTDGRVEAAREMWEEAAKRARRLGMRGLVAAAEATLSVDGDTTPGDSPIAATDEWGLLSPRQREVARLLCGGATNKEMAAKLGLSVRTIDMHVRHILGRLECRSRAEAAARITTLLG